MQFVGTYLVLDRLCAYMACVLRADCWEEGHVVPFDGAWFLKDHTQKHFGDLTSSPGS